MDENDWLAKRFDANRAHLRAVALCMLGSASEADDAVQEAWLKLGRSDTREVENAREAVGTLVARLAPQERTAVVSTRRMSSRRCAASSTCRSAPTDVATGPRRSDRELT